MRTPALGEFTRALRLLATLWERAPGPGGQVLELLTTLGRIVRHDLATLSVFDLQAGRRMVSASPVGVLTDTHLACFDRFLDHHPLVQFHAAHPRAGVRRLSDCQVDQAFRASALFDAYYRPLGLERVLLIPLEHTPMRLTAIELNRAGDDFSDAEVRLLEMVRAPVRALYRQALASACAACATAMLRQLATSDRLGSVRVDRSLSIADASGSALAWLGEIARRAPGGGGGPLPGGLQQWLRGRMDEAAAIAGEHPPSAAVDGPGGAGLALHCVPDPDAQGCTLLIERVLDEPSRRRARPTQLTAREAEVLGWISAGKSDAGIAELLGVSPRTVGKHLQNIYRKLGVENRTGAAMRALGR